MPSARDIKKRIKSVKSTSQITRAMEAVSATKMRKSQEFALRARPYALAGLEILRNILLRTTALPPLMQKREIKKSALLVVTSDKGLAGAFNANVLRRSEQWIEEQKQADKPHTLILVGKKARDYFERRNAPIQRSFVGFGDFSTLDETIQISGLVLEDFLANHYDEIDAVYTHFRTTLKQETFLRKILPLEKGSIEEIVAGIVPEYGRFADIPSKEGHDHGIFNYEYKFEPNPEEILNELIPQLVKIKIHHMILESNASEHSARMVAMKNASESAEDLMSELNLVYNKARQASITRELTEITAGADALN